MDVLSTIQKQYLSFSEKEKLIAEYILQNSDSIRNMKISILAGKIGVSDGTISGFCKKIGCRTFSDLKIQLSSVNARKKIEQTSDSMESVYEFYKQVVERANRMIDIETLSYLIKEIENARYIHLYGLGSSGLTASELMLRLKRMGFQVQIITDSHGMIINSSISSNQDLVIALSVSGETAEIVTAAAIARKNGCKVICFTSFIDSSLAHNSDYCVVVPNSELVDKNRYFNIQFPFMYLIDLITTTFLENEQYNQKMQITVDTIIEQTHIKK